MELQQEKNVYGAGSRKPSTGGPRGEQAGPLPSRSNDRNTPPVGNLAGGVDTTTRTNRGMAKPSSSGASGTESGLKDSARASSSKNPSKIAYRRKRSALRQKERISKIPSDQRTEPQKATLEWATNFLKELQEEKSVTETKPQPKTPGNKRQRSQEESPKEVLSKKRMLYSDLLKDNILVAVIDKGDQDGTISKENWRKVEMALATAFLQIYAENPGSVPFCRDGGWHQGRVKITACRDQRTVDLYRLAISRVGEIWPGANLEAVDMDKIPSRPRARAWIPAEPADPALVMQIIRTSNPGLPTADWKIGRLEDPNGASRQAVIVINRESLKPLAERKGIISYGFSAISLRVYKGDVPKETINTDTVTEPTGKTSSKAQQLSTETPMENDEDRLLTASDMETDLIDMQLDESVLTSDSESNITVIEADDEEL